MADDRWLVLWQHRERLLRIAVRRVPDPADAEDVVSEAVLRGACHADVAAERLPAWLTRVTVNLCYELYRDRARDGRARCGAAVEPSPEDFVCDAVWVTQAVGALPDRQRAALALRADGFDVPGIAAALRCNYKTAESLLSRGRASVRALPGA